MKKWLALVLVSLLVCTLAFGCAKANDGAIAEKGEALMGDTGGTSVDGSDVLTDSVQSTSTATNPGQKLIRKIWLDAETESMDPLLESINQRVTELGGYIESRDIYNGSQYSGSRYRNAELTIRIPADKLDSFVQHVTDNANITSNKETADDITLSYVATESRLKALQTEETRLLELLAEAKDMSDLLQIEDRLTEVRTELEQVKSTLQVYDNQVNYGTVNLSVSEVKEYTVVEEPETVWERIGAGLKESMDNLGNFFTDFFVVIVVSLPYMAILLVPAVVVLLLIRWGRRRRAKKEKEKEE